MRQTVAGRYQILGNQEVGFAIDGYYDPTRTLIIDPILSLQGYLGNSEAGTVQAVTLDDSGNTWLVGGRVYQGNTDVSITKLDSSHTPLAVTYLGGSSVDALTEEALDVAIDSTTGEVIVAGVTDSADFPIVGGYQSVYGGSQDGFVARLSADASNLLMSSYLGGAGLDTLTALALDSTSGEIHLTGGTASTDFDHGSGNLTVLAGPSDAFLTTLTTSGSLVRSQYIGGEGEDQAEDILLSSTGERYLVGSTSSDDFPTATAFQFDYQGGGRDGFALIVRADGSYSYGTYVGGSGTDSVQALAQNEQGQIIVVGTTDSTDLPTSTDAFQSQLSGLTDVFLVTLSEDLISSSASTYLGGTEADEAHEVVLDAYGNALVIGTTGSEDFPVVNSLQDFAASSYGPLLRSVYRPLL